MQGRKAPSSHGHGKRKKKMNLPAPIPEVGLSILCTVYVMVAGSSALNSVTLASESQKARATLGLSPPVEADDEEIKDIQQQTSNENKKEMAPPKLRNCYFMIGDPREAAAQRVMNEKKRKRMFKSQDIKPSTRGSHLSVASCASSAADIGNAPQVNMLRKGSSASHSGSGLSSPVQSATILFGSFRQSVGTLKVGGQRMLTHSVSWISKKVMNFVGAENEDVASDLVLVSGRFRCFGVGEISLPVTQIIANRLSLMAVFLVDWRSPDIQQDLNDHELRFRGLMRNAPQFIPKVYIIEVLNSSRGEEGGGPGGSGGSGGGFSKEHLARVEAFDKWKQENKLNTFSRINPGGKTPEGDVFFDSLQSVVEHQCDLIFRDLEKDRKEEEEEEESEGGGLGRSEDEGFSQESKAGVEEVKTSSCLCFKMCRKKKKVKMDFSTVHPSPPLV